MDNIFSELDGRSIIVRSFAAEHCDDMLTVTLMCVDENEKEYAAVFQNVSQLNMSNISYPFQIGGFEISDCSSRGYQSDAHFFVNDYEDGTMSFYCEKFEIYAD